MGESLILRANRKETILYPDLAYPEMTVSRGFLRNMILILSADCAGDLRYPDVAIRIVELDHVANAGK